MHLHYPLKPPIYTRRRLYAQRHYLAGEGQERHFPTRKKTTNKQIKQIF